MRNGLLLVVLIFLGSTAQAHLSQKAAKAIRASQTQKETFDPNKLLLSVVKIVNNRADVFSAAPSASVGTGFYVGERNGKGIIFTNKHVISSSNTDAQLLTVEFNTSNARGEVIDANLQFVSPIHDFAVIEFDIKKLKRADLSQPLRLPNDKSPFLDFVVNEKLLRGVEVMAIGNPLATSNITTYGHLTGLYFDPYDGPFIQTQTPINPGNSGGPLISLDTFEVIGINTRTYVGADGTHQSIPIGILMEEYGLWLNQKEKRIVPTVEHERSILAAISTLSEGEAGLLDLHKTIETALPGYWDNYGNILQVTDVDEKSALQRDDILLTMNGKMIGGFSYDLRKALQQSPPVAKVKVLRAGQAVDLDVPVSAHVFNDLRVSVDYVYVSGILFMEFPMHYASRLYPGATGRVMVSEYVDSAEANFSQRMYPPEGSLVKAVSFGSQEYPITTMSDLRRALNMNRDKKFMTLRAYRANHYKTEEGSQPVTSRRTGAPFLDGVLENYHIPMTEIVTPFQFSLHKFKKQFRFSSQAGNTRNWRNFTKKDRLPSVCAKLLQGK